MSDDSFSEGDSVTVLPLRREGVVEEALGGEKYRVAVGSMRLTFAAKDLARSKSKPKNEPVSNRPPVATRGPKPPSSLDLHGCTVDEAIRKLDSWLDAVTLSDLDHVKVIHGLGTGRVQAAVHEHLRGMPVVRHFKINDWNPGETDIYL